jgi:hypothetical protein
MGNPTYLYRLDKTGNVEAKIFDDENLPTQEGWVDSPAKLVEIEVEGAKHKAEDDGAAGAKQHARPPGRQSKVKAEEAKAEDKN